jgi:hypothetical protein
MNVPSSKPDHVLDMFMSALLAVLVIGGMLHLAPLSTHMQEGSLFAAALSGVGLLVVDSLMFMDSFMQWRIQRIDAEDAHEFL